MKTGINMKAILETLDGLVAETEAEFTSPPQVLARPIHRAFHHLLTKGPDAPAPIRMYEFQGWDMGKVRYREAEYVEPSSWIPQPTCPGLWWYWHESSSVSLQKVYYRDDFPPHGLCVDEVKRRQYDRRTTDYYGVWNGPIVKPEPPQT